MVVKRPIIVGALEVMDVDVEQRIAGDHIPAPQIWIIATANGLVWFSGQ